MVIPYWLLHLAVNIESINNATGLGILMNQLGSLVDPYEIEVCEAYVVAGRKVCCRSSSRWNRLLIISIDYVSIFLMWSQ